MGEGMKVKEAELLRVRMGNDFYKQLLSKIISFGTAGQFSWLERGAPNTRVAASIPAWASVSSTFHNQIETIT